MATRKEYLTFDLVIEQGGDKYLARVINSPCGQASVEFNKPFSELELENFVLRMGQSRSGVRRIDTPEMQAVKDLGQHLFTTVFSGEVNSCYLRSVDQVRNQNKGLRVRLHINVPEFNNLPWEFLYDPQFDRFVSLSRTTPVIRYFELPYTTRPLPVQAPLKILVMISSPEEYPKLDVQREWETLNQALKPLLDQKSVVLERLEHPTLGALQKSLRQDNVHIFHFIGHGKYFEDKQDGMLLLEDEDGRGMPTSGQYLGTILQDHFPLRLVVLNACEGARTSAEDPYAGVAQTLVRQGIPAVLAMQFVIFEDAAMTFAKEIYSAIVDNYPVDAALSEARKAIFTSNNDVEWGTPVLFMRTPDGVLFQPETLEESAARLEAEREEKERLKKESAEQETVEKEAKEKVERRVVKKTVKKKEGRVTAGKAARGEAEREAVEKEAKEEVEREVTERAAREETERKAAEKAAREEVEREAAEMAAREEAERIAAEKAAREEAERKAAEKAAKEEVEREVAERVAREEAERKAAEKAAREEAEQEAAEKAAKEEVERKVAERAAREKAERKAAEKKAREETKQEAVKKTAKEKEKLETAEKAAREEAEREAAEKAALREAQKDNIDYYKALERWTQECEQEGTEQKTRQKAEKVDR